MALALGARKYALGLPPEAREGINLTLQVEDDERLAPWNTGCWRLRVGSDGEASVELVDDTSAAAPDGSLVRIGIGALTNLWAGAVSARQLSAWGLLEAAEEAALGRCDVMFALEKAPWCCEGY